jgi:hypothetical protein
VLNSPEEILVIPLKFIQLTISWDASFFSACRFQINTTRNLKMEIFKFFSESKVYNCAADAAFRATQPKIAITRWLHLHQKEEYRQDIM